jgi:hypothetical protein
MPERFASCALVRRALMRCGRYAGALVLGGACACGGIGFSGLLQSHGPDGGEEQPETAEADAGSGTSSADDDAAFGSSTQAPVSSSADAAMRTDEGADVSVDRSLDGSGDTPTPPGDATDGSIETDSDTPCGVLLQCCQRLVVAPPLAAACYLSAQATDGGDAGTCGSALASFQDSGLCP